MKARLAAFTRDPLARFLMAGLLLYALYWSFGAAPDNEIRVDHAVIVAELQYRNKAFAPGLGAAALERLSPAERRRLVNDYIDQEVLLREARRYRLDRGDDVIRRRMIEKAEFLSITSAGAPALRPGALASYYEAHAEAFRAPALLTFAHVYFDPEARGADTERIARRAVLDLNTRHAGSEAATRQGDRFPFLTYYVERPEPFVASHFGEGFAQYVSEARPGSTWLGPVRSEIGWHTILLVRRTESRVPPLAEVEAEVSAAYLEDHQRRVRREALDQLRRAYRVRLDAGLMEDQPR